MTFIQHFSVQNEIKTKSWTKVQICICTDLQIFFKLVVVYRVTNMYKQKNLHCKSLQEIIKKKNQKEEKGKEEWRYWHRYWADEQNWRNFCAWNSLVEQLSRRDAGPRPQSCSPQDPTRWQHPPNGRRQCRTSLIRKEGWVFHGDTPVVGGSPLLPVLHNLMILLALPLPLPLFREKL